MRGRIESYIGLIDESSETQFCRPGVLRNAATRNLGNLVTYPQPISVLIRAARIQNECQLSANVETWATRGCSPSEFVLCEIVPVSHIVEEPNVATPRRHPRLDPPRNVLDRSVFGQGMEEMAVVPVWLFIRLLVVLQDSGFHQRFSANSFDDDCTLTFQERVTVERSIANFKFCVASVRLTYRVSYQQ
ncbi:hypothetical protein CVT26_005433 [Gymnopilus dilepis]|uniref:Uncharacterized protein n=1 Tax=Gymnopilus dilepis TaxID=231916 RepID=A0A409W8K1_9AGAR|nr:hypothetical protein CVT26_005433 [Gymnopilus dilepis]